MQNKQNTAPRAVPSTFDISALRACRLALLAAGTELNTYVAVLDRLIHELDNESYQRERLTSLELYAPTNHMNNLSRSFSEHLSIVKDLLKELDSVHGRPQKPERSYREGFETSEVSDCQ